MKIIFATNNKHKLKEVQAVLGDGYRLVTPSELGITEEIPEDRPTIEDNASQKSRYLYERTGDDCFADDTGLEVEALGGEPGVGSPRHERLRIRSDLRSRRVCGNFRRNERRGQERDQPPGTRRRKTGRLP